MLTDEVRAVLDGDFDRDYYRGTYEDIDRAEVDPLDHYFYTGWREGRDPSAAFSTSYYLSSNPDVAAEEVNPLVHYVLTGRREGRQPPVGAREQATRLEPAEDAAEGVVGGNAVRQVEELAEEVELGPAVPLDLGPPVGPGQGAAQGQDDDVDERVVPAAFDAGIGQRFKERCQQFQRRVARHAVPPGSGSVRPTILRGTP